VRKGRCGLTQGFRRIALSCGAVCVCAIVASAQAPKHAEQLAGCRYSEIPLLNASVQFAQLDDQKYYTDRTFFGSVRYHNLAEKTADSIAALIEYASLDRRKLLSVIYFASSASEAHLVQNKLRAENRGQQLEKPVGPGETALLMTSSAMTTLECPATAELKLLDVQYEDGSREHWEASSWESAPVLRGGRQFFPMPCGELLPGFSKLLELRVNSLGEITSIVNEDAVGSGTAECILNGLRAWRFYPALLNGNPVAFDLPILLRVGPKDATSYFPQPSEVPHPLVMVDILPDTDTANQWRPWYGGTPIRDTDEPGSQIPQ